MKRLLAVLAWNVACVCYGALLPSHDSEPQVARPLALKPLARPLAFLAKRDGSRISGIQPWLYNPPPAPLPRSKPMEIPGDPLVLPPVDAMWGMQPSQSPPTIAPPEKQGEVGLQATIPPVGLDGWYATIPPQQIKDGVVDERTAYYLRCLGGPGPCPFTVPPVVFRYWVRVSQAALVNAEATTTLADNVEAGATVINITATAGLLVGREIHIDAGTPLQEVNFIKGFGSLVLQFPLKYAHTKGHLITMPKIPMTTPPPPTMPPFRPWSSFQPFIPFNMWSPGPAPMPFPAPAPAPLAGPYLPIFAPPISPGPAPSPGLLSPAPALGGLSPAPAPFR